MKIIKICALMIFLMSGVVLSNDGHADTDGIDGIDQGQEMFPRSLQAEMDVVLAEYDTISKMLAKTVEPVDPEERATLSARLEVLQKNIGSLSEMLDKQTAYYQKQDQELNGREAKEEDTKDVQEVTHDEKQEAPEVKELKPELKKPELKKEEAREDQPQELKQSEGRADKILRDLAMVEKGFDWISTTLFDRHLLSDQQNLALDTCMHVITTQIKDIKQHVQKIDLLESLENLEDLFAPYKKQIEILQYFANLVKNAAVRYEVFMIGHNDTPQALMKEPLSRAEYQKALCAIFVQLSDVFNQLLSAAAGRQGHLFKFSLSDIEFYFFDKDVLANLVRDQLPVELQLGKLGMIKRKLGFTDQAKRAALAHVYAGIDLDLIYPELFTSYLNIITQFRNNSYGSYKFLSAEFMTDLEQLLALFAQRVRDWTVLSKSFEAKFMPVEQLLALFARDRKHQGYNTSTYLLLKLMMTRLLTIKRIVMQARVWNFDMTNDQESAGLLIAYRALIHNDDYQELFSSKPLSDVRDLLKTVIERYFENKAQTDSFFYDLHVLKYRLIEIRNEVRSHQEYVPKSWAKWLCEYMSRSHYHPALTYLDRMLDLVHKTIELTTPVDSQAKNTPSVIEQILSGQWWSSDTIHSKIKSMGTDKNGKVVLELVDDLQKRQFNDFKSAAFHALSRVSPLLMVGLMKYLLPYASQELGAKIMSFVTDHEQAKNKTGNPDGNRDNNRDSNKVTDFIMNNPEVYEQFSRKHPDVIESLGRQAADKMRA